MNLYCIAIFGTLCYLNTPGNGVDHFAIDYHQMGESGVSISSDNWKVEQELNSDCVGCAPKTGFSKACADADCFSYYRHCDDADHPTMCVYYFDKYPPVDVLAKSPADFQDAVAIVALLTSDDPKHRPLPLSILSKEAPGPHPGTPLDNYMRSPSSKGDTK